MAFLVKTDFLTALAFSPGGPSAVAFSNLKDLYFLTHLLFLVFSFFLFHPVFNWAGHQLKIVPERQNIPLFNKIWFSLIWFQVKQEHLASQFLIQVLFYNLWDKSCIWQAFSQFLQELVLLPGWYLLGILVILSAKKYKKLVCQRTPAPKEKSRKSENFKAFSSKRFRLILILTVLPLNNLFS